MDIVAEYAQVVTMGSSLLRSSLNFHSPIFFFLSFLAVLLGFPSFLVPPTRDWTWPQKWKFRILTTGLPRNSLPHFFKIEVMTVNFLINFLSGYITFVTLKCPCLLDLFFWGGRNFPQPLYVIWIGLRIKLTWNRLTRKKSSKA